MFWALVIISVFALLYLYAFKGIATQKYHLSNGGKIFRRIVLLIFIPVYIFVFYQSFYKYGSTETYSQKIAEKDLYYQKCGKVTQKMEGYSKGENSKYEEQIVVHFDNGEIERMNVSRQTYDRYTIGSGICFAEDTDWSKWRGILLFFGWILTLIGIIICLLYANEIEMT